MAEILDRARAQVLDGASASTRPACWRCCGCPTRTCRPRCSSPTRCGCAGAGPEVEVEGIVSLKTGGCPEDCHFCSQSGLFASPVRSVWLDIPSLVEAAKQTAATGATEFCIVAAVRGPDERLMKQMREGVAAIRPQRRHPGRRVAGHAQPGAGRRAGRDGRAPLQPQPGDRPLALPARWSPRTAGRSAGTPCTMVRESGMEVCCGGILGLGETRRAAGRVRRAAGRAGPARGAAELPQPAPRHAAGRPAGRGGRATRCARSPRSGWRCRAPSCATPAGARSPSATWAPATGCWAA